MGTDQRTVRLNVPVAHTDYPWLTVPEVAERLEITPSRVRRLLEERVLLGDRRQGPLMIPSAFVDDTGPVTELRGTVMLLLDVGFSESEAIDWLLGHEDTLDATPIDALKSGRRSEVRRIAQALL